MFSIHEIEPDHENPSHAQRAAAARIVALAQETTTTPEDVIIVGGGLTGATALYHLVTCAKPPSRVLLLDKGDIGVGAHNRFSPDASAVQEALVTKRLIFPAKKPVCFPPS